MHCIKSCCGAVPALSWTLWGYSNWVLMAIWAVFVSLAHQWHSLMGGGGWGRGLVYMMCGQEGQAERFPERWEGSLPHCSPALPADPRTRQHISLSNTGTWNMNFWKRVVKLLSWGYWCRSHTSNNNQSYSCRSVHMDHLRILRHLCGDRDGY